jgi:CrcB protein
MRFLWVGVAGAVGAIVRYAIGLSIDQSRFPWATLVINLSGALLLGFFLAAALGHLPVSVMTPVAVGLIGGFTTFSTFTWGAFSLGRTGRSEVAVLYIAVSICGGLVAAWAGYAAGRAMHEPRGRLLNRRRP